MQDRFDTFRDAELSESARTVDMFPAGDTHRIRQLPVSSEWHRAEYTSRRDKTHTYVSCTCDVRSCRACSIRNDDCWSRDLRDGCKSSFLTHLEAARAISSDLRKD